MAAAAVVGSLGFCEPKSDKLRLAGSAASALGEAGRRGAACVGTLVRGRPEKRKEKR